MGKKDDEFELSDGGLSSVAGSSVRDAADLTPSESGSDDEVDAEKFGRQNSQRFMRQSSRRVSLASQRYSIKSEMHKMDLKLQALKDKTDKVNFEGAAKKEPLSFFKLAKIVKNQYQERIILDQLKKEKRVLRKFDTINGIFSLSIISIYVIEYEIFAKPSGSKEAFKSTYLNHILRIILFCISVCVCIIQYFHYTSILKIEKILKLRDKKDTIKTSGYLKYLIFEIIVNSIICPPFFDYNIDIAQLTGTIHLSLDSICFFITLLRFYNVLKVPEQYSIWTTEESTKICKKYKFTPNIPFLVKAELRRQPYFSVFGSLFLTVILFGLGVRIFEISYTGLDGSKNEFFETFVNTFWFIFVTMTTVGYGDGYPYTHIGRFIVLWVGVVGTLLVSLMVVALTNTSALSNGEIRVFNKVELTTNKIKAKEKGSELLFNVFLMFISNKKLEKMEQSSENQEEINKEVLAKFGMLSKSRSTIIDFMKIYDKYKKSTSIPEDQILNLLEKSQDKFREVYTELGKIEYIKTNVEQIKENQKELITQMENFIDSQNRIASFLVSVNLNYQSNV